MKERIWECKIGGDFSRLPRGADAPMREAVEAAFLMLTGEEPRFVFSGWAGELTETERKVVGGTVRGGLGSRTLPAGS